MKGTSESLRAKAAVALKWRLTDTYGFSMATLQELVRTVDPDLSRMIGAFRQTDAAVALPYCPRCMTVDCPC